MKRAAIPLFLLVLLALPLAVQAQPGRPLRFEPPRELVGTLRAEVADDFENHVSETRFYLTTDDGKRFEVLLEDGIRPHQLGARVKMKARKVQGEPLFLSRSGDVEVLTEFQPLVAGSLRVVVILFDFPGSPDDRPFTPDFVRDNTFATVRNYYKEVSFDVVPNLEVTVLDWIRLGAASSPCDFRNWSDEARAYWAIRGVDFNPFHHQVYIFPGTASCDWGGRGDVPGAVTWINGHLNGIVHELGHNFGSWHAGGCFNYPASATQPCSSISTYDDYFDVMGESYFPHMAANRKLLLGWSPAVRDVAFSGASQDFEIYPIEFREGFSTQALRTPTPAWGGHLWVELRQPYGFDAPFGSFSDGVLVRYVPPNLLPSSSRLGSGFVDAALLQTVPNDVFYDDILKPGQGFSDSINGIHVFFLGTEEYAPGKKKAFVRVSFGSTPPPPPSCRRPPQVSIAQIDPDSVRKRVYEVRIVNRDFAYGECVTSKPKFTLSFTEPPNAGRWKQKPRTYTTPALPPGQGQPPHRVRIFPKDSLPVGSLHTFIESITSNRTTVHSVSMTGTYRVGNATGTSVGTTSATDTPYPDLKVNGLDDAEVVVTGGTTATVSWTSQYASSCTLSRNGVAIATGLSGTRFETITSARTYTLSCAASDGSSATDTISVVTQASQPAQTPFLGAPFAIPGTIQAEDFDNGGEGIAWHDTDTGNGWGYYRTNVDVDIPASSDAGGGYVIGNAWAGEWIEYTVNVATAGTYTFEARVASGGPGGIFHVEFGGIDKTGPVQVPDTGSWGNWLTLSRTVNLSAGQQVMRVSLDSNGTQLYPAIADFNYFRLTSAATGTGLTGSYFSNPDLFGAPVLTRTEGPIDFAWGSNSPAPGFVDIDNFGVRWTGRIQAERSETYTFWVFSDDGVRLWVNGALLLDRWFDQYGPETASAPITLQAGQSYSIVIEYYERWAGAEIHLSWSSPSTPKQIVPLSRLFPQ